MTSEQKDNDPAQHGGLFGSLKILASTLIAIGQTRLELISTELEEERAWISSMLLWILLALFCAGLGAVMVTLLFVVALWDEHRLLALGIPALLFLLGAGLSWKVVLDKARAKPRLFSASLAELGKDREQLSARQ